MKLHGRGGLFVPTGSAYVPPRSNRHSLFWPILRPALRTQPTRVCPCFDVPQHFGQPVFQVASIFSDQYGACCICAAYAVASQLGLYFAVIIYIFFWLLC